MEQQPQSTGDEAAAMEAPVDANAHANGFAQFDPNVMPDGTNPDAMAGFLQNQPFMGDPNMASMGNMGNMDMGGMQMGDPSMMMPMMFNGQMDQQPQHHADPSAITPDEIALYDRQIRLWGMAAQAKIQNANILLVTMRALANEVAKNLVLAGIGSLTILDGHAVTEADLGAQFLQTDDDGGENSTSHIGQNRAEAAAPALRRLNPRVQIHVDSEGVKTKGPSYFSAYDVVIATDLDPDSFNIINTATRINSKPFYAAGTHGMYGFIFNDLIEHDFVIERDAGNVPTTPHQESRTRSITDVKTRTEGPRTVESVAKRELYSTWFLASDVAVLPPEYTSSKRRLRNVSPALSCLRALWQFMQLQGSRLPSNRDDLKLFTQIATQKHKALSLPSETLRPEFLRSFLQNLGSEVGPVAAIVGGQLAQDVINVLGQTQQPIQNTVIFDGTSMEAVMYPLHPEGILGSSLLSLATDMHDGGGNGGGGADVAAQGGMQDFGNGGMQMGGEGMAHMMQPQEGMQEFQQQPQQQQEPQQQQHGGGGDVNNGLQQPQQPQQQPAQEQQPEATEQAAQPSEQQPPTTSS